MKLKTKIIIDSIEAENIKEAREKLEIIINSLKRMGFELHLDEEFHSHSWLDYGDVQC